MINEIARIAYRDDLCGIVVPLNKSDFLKEGIYAILEKDGELILKFIGDSYMEKSKYQTAHINELLSGFACLTEKENENL